MNDPTKRHGPFTVWGIPKVGDMTDRRGLARFTGSWDEADDYAQRNASPDNPERYVIRDVDENHVALHHIIVEEEG